MFKDKINETVGAHLRVRPITCVNPRMRPTAGTYNTILNEKEFRIRPNVLKVLFVLQKTLQTPKTADNKIGYTSIGDNTKNFITRAHPRTRPTVGAHLRVRPQISINKINFYKNGEI